MFNGNSAPPIASPDNSPIKTSRKEFAGLSRWQTFGASAFLISWLCLFAGGITVDTTRYRCAISPTAAGVLASEGRPGDPSTKEVCKEYVPEGAKSAEATSFGTKAIPWMAILLFILPLNLAMVSASAGVLGALGNKANLEHDEIVPADAVQAPTRSTDTSSPLMSGLLRGLFVYLFFISGLLLFDDKPFSSPGPGQYIRLAGFISLISFLVNYRPHLFTTISDWAFDRINRQKPIPPDKDEVKLKKTTETTETTTLTMPAPKPAVNGTGEQKEPVKIYPRITWLD